MTSQTFQTLTDANLQTVIGGAASGGVGPLSGGVNQQINTNWGGTQIINPPAERPSPYLFERMRQDPSLRTAAPPYKPRPLHFK